MHNVEVFGAGMACGIAVLITMCAALQWRIG